MSIKHWWKSGVLALVLCSPSFAQQDKIIILTPNNPLSDSVFDETDKEFIWHMVGITYKYARQGNHLAIVRRMSKTEADVYYKILQRVNSNGKITPMQMEYVDKITCGTYEIYLLDHVDWSIGNKERTKAIKDYFSYELDTLNYLHQDDGKTDDAKIRQLARFAKRETNKFEQIFNSIDSNSIDIQIAGLNYIIDPEKKREYEAEIKRLEKEREEAKIRYDQEMMRRFGPIDR